MNVDLMDWQTSSLVIGVVFALATIVYLISVFGTLEKSYEEAVEEQRRLSQEMATQNKSDKPKKDKKFKKWGKRTKEKGKEGEKVPLVDVSPGDTGDQENEVHDHVEFKPEAEIILTDSEPEHKPMLKAKKKGKVAPPKSILVNKNEVQTPSESEESPGETQSRDNSFDKVHPKDELELTKYKIEKLERQASLNSESDAKSGDVAAEEKQAEEQKQSSEQKKKPSEGKQEVPHSIKEEIIASVQAPVSGSPRKRNKKNKLEPFDGADGLDISGKKLIELLKNAALNDEEIQLLINVLLNKQQDGSWTKKNDPVATLKKQLQEKEQALEVEQQNTQTATAKVRELHQELGQEKSRTSALEKKLSLLQQEMQALHARMQHAHDQHVAETQALQAKLQQLQTKRNEDHTATVKRLQEDNNRLQQALSQLEAEAQSRNTLEISRLQHEIEQLLAAREQYEARQTAMQQTNDDLHLQIQQLEDHIQQLVTSHQEKTQQMISAHQDKEYNYQQRLAEMTSKLQQMETSRASLMEEALGMKSLQASLEEDNALLRKQLDEIKQLADSRDKEILMLRNNREELQKQWADSESRLGQLQMRMSELADKDSEQQQHIQQLCHEKESLMLQVQDLTEKAAQIPVKQQNGDISNQAQEDARCTEHEKLLKDKEEALACLQSELDKFNSEIVSLREEVKTQQNKNNELREKNWKAMEALEAAQKSAEAADKKLQQYEQRTSDLEKRMKEDQQKVVKSCDQKVKEANERLHKSEDEIAKLRTSYEEMCQEKSRVEEHFRQRVEELQNFVNTVQGKEKELASCLELQQKLVQDVLQRIFPTIKTPICKERSQWLTSFEKEALRYLDELRSTSISQGNSEATKLLTSRLAEANEIISKLEAQVQHYKIALSETENILTKLQSSVEAEEMNWRQKLEAKEDEVIKAIRAQEIMRKEKLALEASLEQLQGVEEATSEMQSKLVELQSKLQVEENEKKSLEHKVEEANNAISTLKDQLKAMEKDAATLEEVKKELENVKCQFEKEKKITKDLSGQILKLDSLVKIGHDSFKAEEKKVQELQAQLQAIKEAAPNGPPHPANPNPNPPQIDSVPVKREKRNKSKRRGASGKK